jgi:hypothetical protein
MLIPDPNLAVMLAYQGRPTGPRENLDVMRDDCRSAHVLPQPDLYRSRNWRAPENVERKRAEVPDLCSPSRTLETDCPGSHAARFAQVGGCQVFGMGPATVGPLW